MDGAGHCEQGRDRAEAEWGNHRGDRAEGKTMTGNA